jgi:hypothetical protein
VPRMAHVLLNRLIAKPGQRQRVEILLEFAKALNGPGPNVIVGGRLLTLRPRWARRDVSASAGDISSTDTSSAQVNTTG